MQKLVKGRNNMGKFGNDKNQVLSFLNLNKIFIASKALNFSNIFSLADICWTGAVDGPNIEAIRSSELICFIEKVKSGPGTESQKFFRMRTLKNARLNENSFHWFLRPMFGVPNVQSRPK